MNELEQGKATVSNKVGAIDKPSVNDGARSDEPKVTVHSNDLDENPTLKKLFKEKDNWRTAAKEKEEELKRLKQDMLVKEENWKQLYEDTNSQLQDQIKKEESFKKMQEEARRAKAFKTELRKLGVREDRVDDLLKLKDYKTSIKIDSDHGVTLGAIELAQEAKKDYYDWFGGQSSGVDSSPPFMDVKDMTMESIGRIKDPKDRAKAIKQYANQKGLALRD